MFRAKYQSGYINLFSLINSLLILICKKNFFVSFVIPDVNISYVVVITCLYLKVGAFLCSRKYIHLRLVSFNLSLLSLLLPILPTVLWSRSSANLFHLCSSYYYLPESGPPLLMSQADTLLSRSMHSQRSVLQHFSGPFCVQFFSTFFRQFLCSVICEVFLYFIFSYSKKWTCSQFWLWSTILFKLKNCILQL